MAGHEASCSEIANADDCIEPQHPGLGDSTSDGRTVTSLKDSESYWDRRSDNPEAFDRRPYDRAGKSGYKSKQTESEFREILGTGFSNLDGKDGEVWGRIPQKPDMHTSSHPFSQFPGENQGGMVGESDPAPRPTYHSGNATTGVNDLERLWQELAIRVGGPAALSQALECKPCMEPKHAGRDSVVPSREHPDRREGGDPFSYPRWGERTHRDITPPRSQGVYFQERESHSHGGDRRAAIFEDVTEQEASRPG